MTILRGVPGSVLWMLAGNDDTNARLCAAAEQLGVGSERLVFAPRQANPAHLARYPLADLFLDTFPYGAHTTASDALWMGLPVLTLSGRAFASRVCGSLVTAAGLGDLVCDRPEQFIELAIALGRDRARIQALRDRLSDQRSSCALFDTRTLVSRLEDLYEEMWIDYAEGKLPLPDLTNMETYGEIGGERDHEASDDTLETALDAEYVTALLYRHCVTPVPIDTRLWTAEAARKAATP